MTAFTIYNEQGKAVYFEQNDKGYCYKEGAGQKKTRIPKAEFEEAHKQVQAEAEKAKAEKKPAKKTKKTKKNVAYKLDVNGVEVTLTEKQKIFFESIPNDQYYDGRGEDCTIWTDAYCDTLADVMNAMVVGAIISTLREKNLITVGIDKVNGKKCKFFALTDLGKAIFRDMGLE